MIATLVMTVAMAAHPPATASTEMLAIDVPDEFAVGHHQRNDRVEIAELVEPPETIDNWSKLVTSLMIFGASQQGLNAFYTNWREHLRSKCVELSDRTVRGRVDSHAAMRASFSCSAPSGSGQPEHFTAFLVQGDANIMMAQIAFRGAETSKEVALVERVSRSLKICDQRTVSACEERRATGFEADS